MNLSSRINSHASHWRLTLALWLLAWLAGGAAQAAGLRGGGFSGMHHQAWTSRDGAPGPVLAMAQTQDGWLWLGTPSGLFRFDGVRFEPVVALAGQAMHAGGVRSLYAAPTGELWIGFMHGGASVWGGSRLAHHGPASGLTEKTVTGFAIGADKRLRASSTTGQFVFDGQHWQREGADAIMVSMAAGADGSLWSKGMDGVLSRRMPGQAQATVVAKAGPGDEPGNLVAGPEGTMWSASHTTQLQRFTAEGRRLPLGSTPADVTGPLLFDHSGMAWYAGGHGMRRVDPAGWDEPALRRDSKTPPDAFGERQGLSAPVVFTLLQDREGNVWVGTLKGVDRFRPARLTRQLAPDGGDYLAGAISAAPDGSLVVAANERPITRIGASQDALAMRVDDLASFHVDAKGSVWVASLRGTLSRLEDGHVSSLALPDSMRIKWLNSLSSTAAGELWAANTGGVFRYGVRGWQPAPRPDGETVGAFWLYSDPEGRVWAAYRDGVLVAHDATRTRAFGPQQGLDFDRKVPMHARGPRLWLGGASGVMLLLGDRAYTLQLAGVPMLRGVSGLVESRLGDLWINGTAGVLRIPAAELTRFLSDPHYRPAFETFDHRDGLEGTAGEAVMGSGTAAETLDGRLWFTTELGLWWIDPARIARNPVAPTATLQQLQSGDQAWPAAGAAITLPRHTTALAIDYTAASLSIPERVRFRYRLDDEPAWQEAGPRRTAYYTGLKPGPHRFQVMAANEDGAWSPAPASLDFQITPTVYEQGWFQALLGLMLVLIVAAGYLLRVRQLTRREVERLQAVHEERDRIAGELHDTLLQGVHGLLLRQHAALQHLQDSDARQLLEAAMDDAERLVGEGRERIGNLRGEQPQEAGLEAALRGLLQQLMHGQPMHLHLQTRGSPAPALSQLVRENLFYITREAVWNALRHSGGSAVMVTLECSLNTLAVCVADDGCGIGTQAADVAAVPGHWGMRGMRERAQRIGAELDVNNAPEGGTRVNVVLRLPAS